jgi:hypothetical protein
MRTVSNMSENTKIIIKSESNELLRNKNYKIKPTLLDGPLFPSLLSSEKINSNRIIGIHFNGNNKSVSEHNNQSDVNIINDYRNPSLYYSNIKSTEDTTLEYLPEHFHITELILNIERMQNEYPQKFNAVSYLADKLFDAGYAKDIYYFGRGSVITVSSGKITPAVGYIIAENATESLALNIVIRGVPLPMRKTKSSEGVYYFTYPQYLLDTDESVNSIQHIEILNQGSAVFYKGSTTAFPLYSSSGDYVNLRIINKEQRNSSIENISDPIWNS